MLFALAFLPMFGIGGLTGLPLGLTAPDVHLHDTYYVIGHFHYVVAPGTIMALFAGIYHWYPKATGRQMNELLGKIHFWGSLICMNGIFLPMLFTGMAGAGRRMFDPTIYAYADAVQGLTRMSSVFAFLLAAAQVPFIINFLMSMKKKEIAKENPWEATTLEWAAPSPPGHGNFLTPVAAYAGPYEYSVPGAKTDFSLQFEKQEA
jgi:cytochrome c oxidase subunit 1